MMPLAISFTDIKADNGNDLELVLELLLTKFD